MAYTKTAILIAAAAALASAQTPQQLDELNVILDDVKSNLSQYMSLISDPSSGITMANLPAGVLNLGMALASATDDSYTTLYKDVDFDGIVPFLTKLPWYSERLADKLAKDLASSAAPASSSEAPATTSSTEAATSSTEAATSSTEAATSSSAAASSSKAEASSSAAPSSSKAESTTVSTKATSAAASTSASATKAAISQINDGQIQAQSTNGAAKVAGMGAGVIAAAALLL
ncbi:hypothetical protein RNJ44_00379 [Nakaseomyces bracarensis]|uniref:Uncharacterized protein n=1 Tax=Nakaseomyces bracarensis TaxID=273131 RepID=A0ABR4NSS3_9SACH